MKTMHLSFQETWFPSLSDNIPFTLNISWKFQYFRHEASVTQSENTPGIAHSKRLSRLRKKAPATQVSANL